MKTWMLLTLGGLGILWLISKKPSLSSPEMQAKLDVTKTNVYLELEAQGHTNILITSEKLSDDGQYICLGWKSDTGSGTICKPAT